MMLKTTVELWKKDKWCIARIPELDFMAQGSNMDEARENLRQVVAIQFSEMREMGTLDDYLSECGFAISNDTVVQLAEMVGFERDILQVA
ncbi:MAG: hypothetical protein HZA20_10690 [Nitrospirae bacterium]|nr:hypothetical protein [Nitrospirota bacterium]